MSETKLFFHSFHSYSTAFVCPPFLSLIHSSVTLVRRCFLMYSPQPFFSCVGERTLLIQSLFTCTLLLFTWGWKWGREDGISIKASCASTRWVCVYLRACGATCCTLITEPPLLCSVEGEYVVLLFVCLFLSGKHSLRLFAFFLVSGVYSAQCACLSVLATRCCCVFSWVFVCVCFLRCGVLCLFVCCFLFVGMSVCSVCAGVYT